MMATRVLGDVRFCWLLQQQVLLFAFLMEEGFEPGMGGGEDMQFTEWNIYVCFSPV